MLTAEVRLLSMLCRIFRVKAPGMNAIPSHISIITYQKCIVLHILLWNSAYKWGCSDSCRDVFSSEYIFYLFYISQKLICGLIAPIIITVGCTHVCRAYHSIASSFMYNKISNLLDIGHIKDFHLLRYVKICGPHRTFHIPNISTVLSNHFITIQLKTAELFLWHTLSTKNFSIL
jgi:hypothetical protein